LFAVAIAAFGSSDVHLSPVLNGRGWAKRRACLVAAARAQIGIVSDRMSSAGRPFVIHNIASGVKMNDVLFAFTITGHYRYLPSAVSKQ
jgi:hypothetical protein